MVPAAMAQRIAFGVGPEQGGSDHRPIVIEVKLGKDAVRPQRWKVARFSYKKANWALFREILDSELDHAAFVTAENGHAPETTDRRPSVQCPATRRRRLRSKRLCGSAQGRFHPQPEQAMSHAPLK
jgi:hypothetical protein